MALKTCSKCRLAYDASHFRVIRETGRPDRLHSWCRDCYLSAKRRYNYEYKRRPEVRAIQKSRDAARRPELNAHRTKRRAQLRRENPLTMIGVRIANSLRSEAPGTKNGRKWEIVVGYSGDQLRRHIEKQFLKGMTWANRRAWHIDHIHSRDMFDLTTETGIRAYWALSNLRPIWREENQAKGAKRLHLI